MCGIFIICNINFINYDILPISNILKKKKKKMIYLKITNKIYSEARVVVSDSDISQITKESKSKSKCQVMTT